MLNQAAVLADKRIELPNAVRIPLQMDSNRLVGLGQVTVGGVTLRDDSVACRPDFWSIDGFHYRDFILNEIVEDQDSIVLRTTAVGRPEVFNSELLDDHHAPISFPTIRRDQHDRLDWIIKPQSLELDGEQYHGFSLGYVFQSELNQVHRFATVSTWGLDGSIVGNTLYHHAQCNDPVVEFSLEDHFTTAVLRRLDMWHTPRGISIQYVPRWGGMQPFDFLTSPSGVFFSYWPDQHSVRSLLQKNVGEDALFVNDIHEFAYAKRVVVPAKHYLFSPSKAPRRPHELANMWTRASDYTGGLIRDRYGIKVSPPQPTMWQNQDGKSSAPVREVAEGPKDDWAWRVDGDKFYFKFEGDEIESHDLLYWFADKMLPQFAARHARCAFIIDLPIHESDFTEYRTARKVDGGWHGDMHIVSVCGTHRFRPASMYDGWRGWRYLAAKANELNIKLGHWFGTNISTYSPILQKHPEYGLKHVNDQWFSGGYGFNVTSTMNWRHAREWVLDDMTRWHDEGLHWLWVDSWANLATYGCDYDADMAPAQPMAAQMIKDLYDIGYHDLRFEGVCPFGAPAYFIFDPMANYKEHTSQAIAGQNDFGVRAGHEYMAMGESLFVMPNEKRTPEERRRWSFRHIANRSLNAVLDEHLPIYNALCNRMDKRYILPDDTGVCWESEKGHALFAYQAFLHKLPVDAKVTAIESTCEKPVDLVDGMLQTQPMTAYRID